MFREVKLHQDERDFHRYLGKDSRGGMMDLRMKRLTFGVRCSPYVATQVIRHLAEQHSTSHPRASRAILQSFYVDDYLAGAPTLEEADNIRVELCQLLGTAGMTLRKWRTSSESFREMIPPDLREDADLKISPGDKPLKALGIHWDVKQDSLSVATPEISPDQPTTKRIIASSLGKVFDLLGLYAPYIVKGKMILRRLWTLQLSWDATPPQDLIDQWTAWRTQLPTISAHQVPRRYSSSSIRDDSQVLHGFADASQEAYGAVVYLLQQRADGQAEVTLILAKARVMPLKALTIPRAELTAAYLLAKLLQYCANQRHLHHSTPLWQTESWAFISW